MIRGPLSRRSGRHFRVVPHHHPGRRRPAHGAAPRHHQVVASCRDAGLGFGDLLRQDRDFDAQRDDGALAYCRSSTTVTGDNSGLSRRLDIRPEEIRLCRNFDARRRPLQRCEPEARTAGPTRGALGLEGGHVRSLRKRCRARMKPSTRLIASGTLHHDHQGRSSGQGAGADSRRGRAGRPARRLSTTRPGMPGRTNSRRRGSGFSALPPSQPGQASRPSPSTNGTDLSSRHRRLIDPPRDGGAAIAGVMPGIRGSITGARVTARKSVSSSSPPPVVDGDDVDGWTMRNSPPPCGTPPFSRAPIPRRCASSRP